MIESKKQFKKDDMHFAAMIVGNKFSEIADEKARMQRQTILFHAGVPGVPDPSPQRSPRDFYEAAFLSQFGYLPGLKPMDNKDMDRAQARALGLLEPPRRNGDYSDIFKSPFTGLLGGDMVDAMGMMSYFDQSLAEGEERCGYCNKIKPKKDWCGNYRCKSNQKRRGEL